MKTTCSITVRGREKTWSLPIIANPEQLKAWQADGLPVTVAFVVPVWAQRLGLTWVWCRVQDGWNWIRLW